MHEGREVELYGWTIDEINQQVNRDGASAVLSDCLAEALRYVDMVNDRRLSLVQAKLTEILNRAKFIADQRVD